MGKTKVFVFLGAVGTVETVAGVTAVSELTETWQLQLQQCLRTRLAAEHTVRLVCGVHLQAMCDPFLVELTASGTSQCRSWQRSFLHTAVVVQKLVDTPTALFSFDT